MKKPRPIDVGKLTQTLSKMYPNDGSAPGIQVAYLQNQQEFYVAIHRYPHGSNDRRVVNSACASTVLDAIRMAFSPILGEMIQSGAAAKDALKELVP